MKKIGTDEIKLDECTYIINLEVTSLPERISRRDKFLIDVLSKPLKASASQKQLQIQKKPQLNRLVLVSYNLPISWGKIISVSAADYEDRINELWGAGNYRSAKWNQKLAWLCALSNLGYYLWLKAWKPVRTVFRRLL